MDVESLLEDLFGFSDEDQTPILPVTEVPGLHIAKSWLPAAEQAELVAILQREHFQDGVNQGMHFGVLPDWLTKITARMQNILPGPVWSRQPLFDSLILNRYRPGDGICAHVDLLRFEDGIAVLSLGSQAVMNFAPAVSSDQGYQQQAVPQHQQQRVQVPLQRLQAETGERNHLLAFLSQALLEPGDLLLLQGPARYDWTHGIDAVAEEMYQGRRVVRGDRMSITMRRLRPDQVLTEAA